MIILIDTSTPICRFSFIDEDWRHDYQWQADRGLAKGLLLSLNNEMQKINKNWSDISAIGVFRGPGSFTGLRIGMTVMNTIANSQQIPIVGSMGENWQIDALSKINSGKNDKIVLPFYESEAHITIAKK